MQITEKQAAKYVKRTLESAIKRLTEQQSKYGGDFPYIDSALQSVIDKAMEQADDMEVIARD